VFFQEIFDIATYHRGLERSLLYSHQNASVNVIVCPDISAPQGAFQRTHRDNFGFSIEDPTGLFYEWVIPLVKHTRFVTQIIVDGRNVYDNALCW
jgi:hypothetical protein